MRKRSADLFSCIMGHMRIPQKSEVRHVSGNIRDLESQLKQIIGSEKTDEKRIRRAVDNHTEASAMEILNRTDVEELNRSGERIRVNALRREGYTNIGRLVGTSYSKLEGLEGIGEQSASLIRRKVKQMYKELKEQVLLRIRTDNPEKEDRELVQALYIYLHSKDVRSEADKLYRAYHEQIRQDLKQAAVLEGSLRRLFAGRERKEEAAQAYEALRQLDTKAYRKQVMSLVQQHRSVNRTVSDICMEAFRRNAALYYAALSSFDDRPVKVDHYGLSDKLIESIDAVELSDRHLKAVLRPYQTFGVKYILHQKKVMLGDEMGLGKTVEAIAVMTNLAAEGMSRFLVVCPASVIVNWEREIRKFSDLEPRLIRGYDARGLQEWLAEGGAGITTYETIVRMSLPPEIRLDLLVADEAHYVKNPSALRTAAMRRLTMQADRILFMTGTPLENRVEEMSLLVGMLSHSTGEELSRYDSISSAPKYRRILAPVYLRRRREDVLNELPEKEEIENWVEMTEEDQQHYRAALRADRFMDLRRVSWQTEDPEQSAKAMRLLEICEEAHVNGYKVIVFSFFRDTLDAVSRLLGDLAAEQITGSVSSEKRQEIIDRFTLTDDHCVLPAQVIAGGTGLNIQAANIVVFCEPQLKPSVENQAVSRVYRMGQTQKVIIHRLLCVHTIDERIMDLLTDKQELFDRFADDSLIGTESLKMTESAWIKQAADEERKRWGEEKEPL